MVVRHDQDVTARVSRILNVRRVCRLVAHARDRYVGLGTLGFEPGEMRSERDFEKTPPFAGSNHWSKDPVRSYLEPRVDYFVVFNLVDRNDIHLAGAFRKGANHRFMIDHQVAGDDAAQQPSKKVWLPEPHDMAFTNFRRTRRK